MRSSLAAFLRDRLRSAYRHVRTAVGHTPVVPDGGSATHRGARLRRSEFVKSLPFWLPSFLAVALFIYGSIGWNLLISLTDYQNFGSPTYDSLDVQQYIRAVNDPEVLTAARNTFVLLVTFTVLCLLVGLGLAVLLDRALRFRESLRLVYLLPFSLSFIVTAQVWLWLYNSEYGLVNIGLRSVGLPGISWIGDPRFVLAAIVIALVWQFSGYAMVVYLAGLRAIPTAHFEAARVDGASTLRTYQRIIIPQLRAATVSAAVVLMVFALKAFDFLYALFGGYRPRKGADILATKMVREAFQQRQWAYGAAIAILMFLLALAIISPYLYTQYQRGEL